MGEVINLAEAAKSAFEFERFRNRMLCMRFIDGWRLPELPEAEKVKFVRNPWAYFTTCAEPRYQIAIWREIFKEYP